jgi:hypothetical protein
MLLGFLNSIRINCSKFEPSEKKKLSSHKLKLKFEINGAVHGLKFSAFGNMKHSQMYEDNSYIVLLSAVSVKFIFPETVILYSALRLWFLFQGELCISRKWLFTSNYNVPVLFDSFTDREVTKMNFTFISTDTSNCWLR